MIGYAVIGIGLVGFVVGLMLHLKTFLISVGLVLIASVVYSVDAGLGFISTFLNIMMSEVILQGSYFAGLAARSLFSRTGLWSTL